MNNLDVLKQTGALEKKTRPLDFGGYTPQFTGQLFEVWVNPPGIIDDFLSDAAAGNARDMAKWRKVVSILFEMPLMDVQQMDDQLVTWLFSEGYRLYDEYHTELKKTSVTS